MFGKMIRDDGKPGEQVCGVRESTSGQVTLELGLNWGYPLNKRLSVLYGTVNSGPSAQRRSPGLTALAI